MNHLYQLLIFRNPILLFVFLFICESCVQDIPKNCTDRKINATITFNMPKRETRAFISSEEEKKISNMYLMIFDSDGVRVRYDGWDKAILPDANQLNAQIVRRNVPLQAGVKYTFTLLINIGTEQELMNRLTVTQLNQISSYSQMKEAMTELKYNTLSRINANLFMSGIESLVVNKTTEKITIPVKFKDVKISFKIQVKDGDSFIPDKWSVYNLPRTSSICPNDNNEQLSGKENYFNVINQDFEGNGKSIEFYMLPNSKTTLNGQSIKALFSNLSQTEQYKMREKQEKNNTDIPYRKIGYYVTNGPFIYADPFSTYVVINGRYKNKEGNITAYTKYVIHLGYIKDDPDNWEAVSNSSYTYTIHINGIHEMKVEVMEDKEVNPGAEGHIYEKGNIDMELDASYGTGGIIMTPEQVKSAQIYLKSIDYDYNKCFRCYTPFDIYGQKDYSWIQFKQNTPGRRKLEPYVYDPKLKAYDPGLLDIYGFFNAIKNYDTSSRADLIFSVYINEFYYDKKPKWITFNGDWEADGWRTFVNVPDRIMQINLGDEIVSDSRDKQSSYIKPSISIRQKSIKTPYSLNPDIFPNGKVAIGMQAVQYEPSYCWYNDALSLSLGSGIEDRSYWNGIKNSYNFYKMVNKSMEYINFRGVYDNDFFYSLAVTKTAKVNNFSPQFQCLRWNRDSNGDGVIQEEELKWYIPSIEEITLLGGLGNNSIPMDSRLNRYPDPINSFQHFATSTRTSNYAYNKYAYFSEQLLCFNEQIYSGMVREPITLGNQTDIYDYVEKSGYARNGKNGSLNFRCVRRLGKVNKLQPADKPFNLENNKPYKISVSLDYNSTRSGADFLDGDELPEHNQKSLYNKPYHSFFVAEHLATRLNVNDDTKYLFTYNDAKQACSSYREAAGGKVDGWRLPNASEMSIMMQVLNDGQTRYGTEISKSGMGWHDFDGAEYSINSKNNASYTNIGGNGQVYWTSTVFSIINKNPMMQYVYAMNKGILAPIIGLARTGNTLGYVRCVKDAPSNK